MRESTRIYNEIEILKKAQKGEPYGEMICDCLKEVMEVINNQDHTGMSIQILKEYLDRCIDGKCLTPIMGTDDEWCERDEWDTEGRFITNKRMFSLSKDTTTGKYHDSNRTVFVNTYDDKNTTWHSGEADDIIDELYPITMPYMPTNKPFKVYGADMYLDENGNDVTNENPGSYNYTRFDYIVTPNGEKIDISGKYDWDGRNED